MGKKKRDEIIEENPEDYDEGDAEDSDEDFEEEQQGPIIRRRKPAPKEFNQSAEIPKQYKVSKELSDKASGIHTYKKVAIFPFIPDEDDLKKFGTGDFMIHDISTQEKIAKIHVFPNIPDTQQEPDYQREALKNLPITTLDEAEKAAMTAFRIQVLTNLTAAMKEGKPLGQVVSQLKEINNPSQQKDTKAELREMIGLFRDLNLIPSHTAPAQQTDIKKEFMDTANFINNLFSKQQKSTSDLENLKNVLAEANTLKDLLGVKDMATAGAVAEGMVEPKGTFEKIFDKIIDKVPIETVIPKVLEIVSKKQDLEIAKKSGPVPQIAPSQASSQMGAQSRTSKIIPFLCQYLKKVSPEQLKSVIDQKMGIDIVKEQIKDYIEKQPGMMQDLDVEMEEGIINSENILAYLRSRPELQAYATIINNQETLTFIDQQIDILDDYLFPQEKFICDKCGHEYKSPESLEIHMKQHEKGKGAVKDGLQGHKGK